VSLRLKVRKKPQVEWDNSTLQRVQDGAYRAAERIGPAAQRLGPAAQRTADRIGPAAQKAADRIGPTAQRAAEMVGPAAQQARDVAALRVTDAREWSAPRIEYAAGYVENELGPRVGSLLSRTAKVVEPEKPRRRRRGVALVLLAVGGALGAAGIVSARRNAAARESDLTPFDLQEAPKAEDHYSAN
jgi:hypothetical protein